MTAAPPEPQEARLVVNGDEFATKMVQFSLKCLQCGSRRVTLDIDWAAYPSGSWCHITFDCLNCKYEETIYET